MRSGAAHGPVQHGRRLSGRDEEPAQPAHGLSDSGPPGRFPSCDTDIQGD